jgi:hypothetical protein
LDFAFISLCKGPSFFCYMLIQYCYFALFWDFSIP